jgi:hypothetical protein
MAFGSGFEHFELQKMLRGHIPFKIFKKNLFIILGARYSSYTAYQRSLLEIERPAI